MQILPVKTWSQQKAFLDFPWKIYKDDPYWVPQLRMEQSGLVGFTLMGHKEHKGKMTTRVRYKPYANPSR